MFLSLVDVQGQGAIHQNTIAVVSTQSFAGKALLATLGVQTVCLKRSAFIWSPHHTKLKEQNDIRRPNADHKQEQEVALVILFVDSSKKAKGNNFKQNRKELF